jgi:tartrate-resistant acid phosphatase type 5
VPGAILFAAIGDYGADSSAERDVANLIKSWSPDFIITLGDNNYPVGAADHIDRAIGKYFHSYIFPYQGSYGEGSDDNRFFPSIGNHDLMTDAGQPYYDYFTLPGNERYYDFTWGPVHFFVLNDVNDPDGVSSFSNQGNWLFAELSASNSPWNIVYMHFPPYSSGLHGSTDWAQWPFEDWGVDAVLSGHDHTYERLQINGVTYFVDGMGGNGIYDFPNIVEGSQVRYNGDYGAMKIEATDNSMLFEFYNRSGELIDSYELTQ